VSRRRVMHVVVAGDIGGAERLLVDLATRPAQTDVDHEVALMTPNRALAAYFVGAGLRVHDRGPVRENPISYLYRNVGPVDVDWLSKLLVDQQIDVAHTHTFGSHVLGTRAALRAGRAQVRTEHHVMHYFDPSCSLFTRWAAARTRRFVAISEYVRAILARTAPAVASRCTVIRNAVDTEYWSPRQKTAAGPFRVGIVCRLTAWKRVHLAIAAASIAGVELLVIGDGEERLRLEAVATERGGAVRFVGRQLDPRPFVASCDVIVSAAKNEPLGLSVLESLAMEKPIIAFRGGGIPEIVQDGVTGILVDDATEAALAAAIARSRGQGADLGRMGAAGRRFVLQQCNVTNMCSAYAEIYRELSQTS
jgi:glycosyltransferase involved in cell wall biosynthesis